MIKTEFIRKYAYYIYTLKLEKCKKESKRETSRNICEGESFFRFQRLVYFFSG